MGSAVARRTARTTSGPTVRLGTKCPSITSTCTRPAPPRSTRRTSSASWPKSADRIEGARIIVLLAHLEAQRRAPARAVAGGRGLAQHHARRHSRVAAVADVSDLEAGALQPDEGLLDLSSDQVGHQVVRAQGAAA